MSLPGVLQRVRIPEWVRWLAQDADGTWWGFEAEPHPGDIAWYENEVGRYRRLASDIANARWQDSLTRTGIEP
ncbi:MAG: hypothetical protein H6981_06515 [Gammaproteobacteria bacterium]|nr:hypothetical protein [Gammaproteobacteria bacterium]MCP5136436.1 hypothetical protein [Gammaproteobacteria bacterium]